MHFNTKCVCRCHNVADQKKQYTAEYVLRESTGLSAGLKYIASKIGAVDIAQDIGFPSHCIPYIYRHNL